MVQLAAVAEGATPLTQTYRAEERPREARVQRLYDWVRHTATQKQRSWQPVPALGSPGLSVLPLVLGRARAFAITLREMPIEIGADELIVGKSAIDGVIYRTSLPEFATEAERAGAKHEGSSLGAGLSHKVPGYDDLLSKGLLGLIAEIEERQAQVAEQVKHIVAHIPDTDGRLAAHAEQWRVLQAMKLECEAAIGLAGRFADLAERQAASEPRSRRRDELLQIAEVCRRVPAHPARTFHEALQAVWLVHYALFSTGTKLSLGRIDQYCGPYLEADLAARRLTAAEAQELVDCLWIKFNDRMQILRENFAADFKTHPAQAGIRRRVILEHDAQDAVNHFGQNILLSGLTPDGRDGTNAMTWLCLNALEKFEFTSPVTTVRLHRDSPRALIRRCAEVLKTGGGMPYLANDEAIVTAYTKLGVPLEDARDYANSNCWETMIAGKSDQEMIRGVNFLLILEWVLRRGAGRVFGQQDGIDTGDPRAFRSFDDLLAAWKRQLDVYLAKNIDAIGRRYSGAPDAPWGHGRYAYNPLLSALVRDSIERGRDLLQGGARYSIWHVMGEAVSNCTDALAAIRRLVFEQRAVTMGQLVDALERNWSGPGDEALRQRVLARAPKFANDDPAADDICRTLMDYFVERTRRYGSRYPQVVFPCSVGTFSWYSSIGYEVAASGDGRFTSEPIAANFSPALGADTSGPTAALKSYVQMRMDDLAAGAPCDLRFAGSQLRGEAGTDRLAGFIAAFVALCGNMLTVTVTDVELLKRAMAEPEKYRGLRVRMGGWSAYFVALSPEQQRVQIARVEHGFA
jgi:formate C-acetyltransferase